MVNIFTVLDETGRIISLSSKQWRHMQKHAKMSGTIECIKETLFKPEFITRAIYDPKLRIYYRHYKSFRKYLFILVKYLNGKGFVITSYYTRKLP